MPGKNDAIECSFRVGRLQTSGDEIESVNARPASPPSGVYAPDRRESFAANTCMRHKPNTGRSANVAQKQIGEKICQDKKTTEYSYGQALAN